MRAEDCTPSAPSNSASASPRRYLVRCFGSLRLLYLNERLGLAVSTATRSIGAFNGAVHLAAVLSGVVTDRWLGTRFAVLIGATLLALGYATHSPGGARLLYEGAALLVTGHSLFKPSITFTHVPVIPGIAKILNAVSKCPSAGHGMALLRKAESR